MQRPNPIALALLTALALFVEMPAQTPPASKPATKPAAKPVTHAAVRPRPAAPALTTDDQKTIYALGFAVYRNVAQFDLTPAELEIVQRAIRDAAAGKPAFDTEPWQPKIATLKASRATVGAQKRKVTSEAFLAKAAAAPGAVKTDSGLIYRELKPGTGASPASTDTVKVNYRGTFIDGTEFDSSYKRNEPATFPVNGVIKCWTEGLQKMKVGGKAQLVCPSSIAYGDGGRPSIPGGSTLLFDVELLDIVNAANSAGDKK